MNVIPTLTAAQRADLEAYEERALSAGEFTARAQAPWSEVERNDFAALTEWFQRRYPTPFARLQATRHLATQWERNRPR